jgi:hypothetical protein
VARQHLCRGDCRLVSAVVRNMGKASEDELASIQAVVSDLLGKYEARMDADLVTALCRWSEAADRHLKQHDSVQQADDLAARRRAVS